VDRTAVEREARRAGFSPSRSSLQPFYQSLAMRVRKPWTHDASWADKATLIDYRRDNCCTGVAGCQAIYCTFQMWDVNLPCSTERMSSVLFQMERFAWAQLQLQSLLRNPPTPLNLSAIGNEATRAVLFARAREGNATVQAKPAEWARWCTQVMRCVALMRWASNVRWHFLGYSDAITDAGKSLVDAEKAYYIRLNAMVPRAQSDTRTRSAPLPPFEYAKERFFSGPFPSPGAPDAFSHCEVVGGVGEDFRAGERGMSVWHRYEKNLVLPTLVSLTPNVAGYDQPGGGFSRLDANCGLYTGLDGMPLDFVKVPTSEADFDPRLLVSAAPAPATSDVRSRRPLRWVLPRGDSPARRLFSRGGTPDAESLLAAWFSWRPRPYGAGAAQYESLLWEFDVPAEVGRGLVEAWTDPTYVADRTQFFPSPYAQVLYCASLASDAAGCTFGEVIGTAMKGWGQAYNALPERFRALPPEEILRLSQQATQANLDIAAGVAGTVLGAITSVVTAINPVVGAVLAAVFALVAELIRAAQELCITRAKSPPCLGPPFIRSIDTDAAIQMTACDFRTTGAGGAEAVATKAAVLRSLGEKGISSGVLFDSLNKLREDSPAGTGSTGVGTDTDTTGGGGGGDGGPPPSKQSAAGGVVLGAGVLWFAFQMLSRKR
jgi:hypothetical protein